MARLVTRARVGGAGRDSACGYGASLRGDADGSAERDRTPMTLVVHVGVLAIHRLTRVLVPVPLRHVQPDAQAH